jgi:predicted 3-demethylubiquinone-9 3-methyltransferase (glyoxalase superfamily)
MPSITRGTHTDYLPQAELSMRVAKHRAMRRITPLLWFEGLAEEAAQFYVSIFKDSKIDNVSHFEEGGPGKPGSAMMVEFTLEGQEFMALNGGGSAEGDSVPGMPRGSIALFITCETQAEVDHLWDALGSGGEIIQCGWLKDKYGFTWNIVPKGLAELLADPDREKAQRAMQAMLAMKKLDINELRRAFEGSAVG